MLTGKLVKSNLEKVLRKPSIIKIYNEIWSDSKQIWENFQSQHQCSKISTNIFTYCACFDGMSRFGF